MVETLSPKVLEPESQPINKWIVCDIEPVSKARSKTVFHGGKVWSYTPKKTQTASDFIKLSVKQLGIEQYQPHIPLKLSVIFYRTRPKNIPKGEDRPVRKPDLDNFLKLIVDALVPDIIPDDAQITTMNTSKFWTNKESGYVKYLIEVDNETPTI
jgi:Holliday junction resolvase RusA-like endonuclease